jgi:hypothetical protein
MAAAEKFKAAEPPTIAGEAPSGVPPVAHESDEEEVKDLTIMYVLIAFVQSCIEIHD